MNKLKYLGLCLVTVLSVISCQADEDIVDIEIPSTITHELQEVFRIVDDPAGIYFHNAVSQIEFLSNGNLIIRGGRNMKNVLEVSPNGELVATIGREGQGPGEFESINRILVTPGDSLFIYDSSLARQQLVVKTDGNWQLTRALPVERPSSEEFISQYPLKVFQSLPDGNGYRALITNNIGISDTTESFYYYLTDVDKDLVQTGSMDFLKFVQDAAVYRLPFGVMADWDDRYKRTFYLFNQHNNQLITINNWSNEIWLQDQNGDEQMTGLLPFEHFPIDESVNENIERITEFGYRAERIQLIESKYLDHEPYFQSIYLDRDKLWIRFAREDKSDPEWAISTTSGEIEAVFHNPENFDPLTVHNGRLYGLQQVNDIPNLVSLELDD